MPPKKSAPHKDRRWFDKQAHECRACRVPAPKTPRSYLWDCHMLGDVMIATCSPACRQALGLFDRKLQRPVLAESLDDLFS
jgi:hypothetical protein